MPQRKFACRLGQACPASLFSAKSAETEKAGTTQHSAKQFSQSARRLRRSPWVVGSSAWSCFSDNVCGLLREAIVLVAASVFNISMETSITDAVGDSHASCRFPIITTQIDSVPRTFSCTDCCATLDCYTKQYFVILSVAFVALPL